MVDWRTDGVRIDAGTFGIAPLAAEAPKTLPGKSPAIRRLPELASLVVVHAEGLHSDARSRLPMMRGHRLLER